MKSKRAYLLRVYYLGIGTKTFKFNTPAERKKGIAIAKASHTRYSTWHADIAAKPKKVKKNTTDYVKPKFVDLKYKYVQSVTKVSEGGRGTADVLKSFKNRPIDDVRLESVSSTYIGQAAFGVYAINKSAMTKAMMRLKELGYIDAISRSLRYINRM